MVEMSSKVHTLDEVISALVGDDCSPRCRACAAGCARAMPARNTPDLLLPTNGGRAHRRELLQRSTSAVEDFDAPWSLRYLVSVPCLLPGIVT
jgi:hypothetical protein